MAVPCRGVVVPGAGMDHLLPGSPLAGGSGRQPPTGLSIWPGWCWWPWVLAGLCCRGRAVRTSSIVSPRCRCLWPAGSAVRPGILDWDISSPPWQAGSTACRWSRIPTGPVQTPSVPRDRETLFDFLAADWEDQLAKAFRQALEVRSGKSLAGAGPAAGAVGRVHHEGASGPSRDVPRSDVPVRVAGGQGLDRVAHAGGVVGVSTGRCRAVRPSHARLASPHWPTSRVEPDVSAERHRRREASVGSAGPAGPDSRRCAHRAARLGRPQRRGRRRADRPGTDRRLARIPRSAGTGPRRLRREAAERKELQ